MLSLDHVELMVVDCQLCCQRSKMNEEHPQNMVAYQHLNGIGLADALYAWSHLTDGNNILNPGLIQKSQFYLCVCHQID